MKTFYFTFGSGHHDTRGRTLMGWYTSIEAETETEARAKFFEKFGEKWSFTYTDPEFQDQIQQFGLQYEPFEFLDLCCQVKQDEYLKLKKELANLKAGFNHETD